jgi:hypothetical protein
MPKGIDTRIHLAWFPGPGIHKGESLCAKWSRHLRFGPRPFVTCAMCLEVFSLLDPSLKKKIDTHNGG